MICIVLKMRINNYLEFTQEYTRTYPLLELLQCM